MFFQAKRNQWTWKTNDHTAEPRLLLRVFWVSTENRQIHGRELLMPEARSKQALIYDATFEAS